MTATLRQRNRVQKEYVPSAKIIPNLPDFLLK
jgi:hypothetical protein